MVERLSDSAEMFRTVANSKFWEKANSLKKPKNSTLNFRLKILTLLKKNRIKKKISLVLKIAQTMKKKRINKKINLVLKIAQTMKK